MKLEEVKNAIEKLIVPHAEETLRSSGVNSTGMACCSNCGSHEHVSESTM